MNKLLTLISFVLVFILLIPSHAYAYIDPGTGSLVLQGLAAAVISLMFFGRKIWSKVTSFFSKQEPPGDKTDVDVIREGE